MRASVPIRTSREDLLSAQSYSTAHPVAFVPVAATVTWLLLTFGTPALLVVALVLAWASLARDRVLRIGWLLIGSGVTALSFAALAYQRCSGAAAAGAECVLPDTTWYSAVSVALVILGGALLFVGARRSPTGRERRYKESPGSEL